MFGIVLGAVLIFMILVTLPSHSNRHEQSRVPACISNVRQIGLAFRQYAVDHDGAFPCVGSTNDPVNSCSVFKQLTNGNYLAVGKIYLCPSASAKTTGNEVHFTSSNNTYACVVASSKGFPGLTESDSAHNPLVLDSGLVGAPGFVVRLQNSTWAPNSSHGIRGGSVFYVDGHVEFKTKLETGKDGDRGYILEP